MRLTAVMMLVLAVALGAMSVYLARDWLERQGESAAVGKPSIELTKIVVAKRPMNFGDTVTKEYLTEVDWPANMVPPESFGSIDDLTGDEERRVVLRAIQVNEPVHDVNGVAGFVLPGDKVDVLLTRDENTSARNKNPITDILLQNIKVLGIDQKANDDEDKPQVARAVTLEVEPLDAQKLALASTVGSLSLALRNQGDANADFTKTVRVSDLKAAPMVVEVIEPASVTKEKDVAEAAPKKRRKVYVAPLNPFANVTVVRGVDSSTQSVLKDKAGNVIAVKPKAATTVPAVKAAEEEEEPKGPKILVPPQG
jgi:pilus assembly protein CpaB